MKHTIDHLIDLASAQVGATVYNPEPTDPMEPRKVKVLSGMGEEIDIQISAKATLEQVIELINVAYNSRETLEEH